MEYFKIKKKCPFCPNNKSSYLYRTYHGLYRHIFRWHLRDENKKSWSETIDKEPAFIRVYKVKFSTYYDIPIKGKKHVEAIIDDYCRGLNPSLRGIKWTNGKK